MSAQRVIRAGVMGWPVEHSKSPLIHGFWLEEHGIAGRYERLPVEPEALEGALKGLGDAGFAGCNLTIPHKEAGLALCDRLSATARRIGAVNTVVVEDGGALYGDNTDAYGFYRNLVENAPDWSPETGPAVVLGAGGAARAVLTALHENGCPEIRVLNRTRVRAEALLEGLEIPGEVYDWGRADALAGANLLVNTTSLGMAGMPALEIDLGALPEGALVNDIVYTPLETGLLSAAEARGNPVVDGLGMLLHQAVPGFAAWFGVRPRVTAALRAHVLGAAA